MTGPGVEEAAADTSRSNRDAGVVVKEEGVNGGKEEEEAVPPPWQPVETSSEPHPDDDQPAAPPPPSSAEAVTAAAITESDTNPAEIASEPVQDVQQGIEQDAPQQQQQDDQQQEQATQQDATQQDVQQEEIPGDAGGVTFDADIFASLGSAEDIAAAAIQSANLTGLFGGPEETEEVNTDAPSRGTKRSREETDATAVTDGDGSIQSGEGSSGAGAGAAAAQPPPVSEISTAPAVPEASSSAPSTSAAPYSTAAYTSAAPAIDQSAASAAALALGSLDLHAVAQAAMGLDADGNPLPGNEESHRALAEAVKQLSAAQGITLPAPSSRDSEDGDNGKGPVKRFQCTQCERAFARAYNLNTHLATHDPDPSRSKPFPCPYPSCKTDGGRSFSRKHDLQRHVASTHENEPEPAIEGASGGNGGGLASLGLGQPGRKFRCDDCGRAFVRRDALKRHQCIRSNESYDKPPPDYLSNVAAGLSLYTSNTVPSSSTSSSHHQTSVPATNKSMPTQESMGGSSTDSDPFGPNGITYEHLSKEVQDMAMQLVAQAQSYNEQKSSTATATATATSEPAVSEPVPAPPPPPTTSAPIIENKQAPVVSTAPVTTSNGVAQPSTDVSVKAEETAGDSLSAPATTTAEQTSVSAEAPSS